MRYDVYLSNNTRDFLADTRFGETESLNENCTVHIWTMRIDRSLAGASGMVGATAGYLAINGKNVEQITFVNEITRKTTPEEVKDYLEQQGISGWLKSEIPLNVGGAIKLCSDAFVETGGTGFAKGTNTIGMMQIYMLERVPNTSVSFPIGDYELIQGNNVNFCMNYEAMADNSGIKSEQRTTVLVQTDYDYRFVMRATPYTQSTSQIVPWYLVVKQLDTANARFTYMRRTANKRLKTDGTWDITDNRIDQEITFNGNNSYINGQLAGTNNYFTDSTGHKCWYFFCEGNVQNGFPRARIDVAFPSNTSTGNYPLANLGMYAIKNISVNTQYNGVIVDDWGEELYLSNPTEYFAQNNPFAATITEGDFEKYGNVDLWYGRYNRISAPSNDDFYTGKTANGSTYEPSPDYVVLHLQSNGDVPDVPPDDFYPTKEPDDDPTEDPDPDLNAQVILTTTYTMGKIIADQFASAIFNKNFFDDWKTLNPLENIVACKIFPFSLQPGTTKEIVVGYYKTGIDANTVTKTVHKIDITLGTVNRYFNNFFDFPPYTNIAIYIPFVGIITLHPDMIYGKQLTLRYAVDVVTGSAKISLKAGGHIVQYFEANMGVDIPLASTNLSQIQAGFISGIASAGLSLLGGAITKDVSVAGTASNGIGDAISAALTPIQYDTKFTGSPATAFYQNQNVWIIITRQKYMIPANYASQVGHMCMRTMTLNNLRGFTVATDLDMTGLASATEEEKSEIRRLLAEGVYF